MPVGKRRAEGAMRVDVMPAISDGHGPGPDCKTKMGAAWQTHWKA